MNHMEDSFPHDVFVDDGLFETMDIIGQSEAKLEQEEEEEGEEVEVANEEQGNSQTSGCVVCGDDLDKIKNSFPCASTMMTASNVAVSVKLKAIFDLHASKGIVCQTCFDLLEELDVFEQNIIRTKRNLRQRYLKSKKLEQDSQSSLKRNLITTTCVSGVEEPIKIECKVELNDSSNVYWSQDADYLNSESSSKSLFIQSDEEESLDDSFIDDCSSDDVSFLPKSSKRQKKSTKSKNAINSKKISRSKRKKHNDANKTDKSKSDSDRPISQSEFDILTLDLPPNSFDSLLSYYETKFEPNQCSKCPQIFTSWDDKMKHYVMTHIEMPESSLFICPADGAKLDLKGLESHAVTVHGIESIQDFGSNTLAHSLQFSEEPCNFGITLENNHVQCSLCGLISTTDMAFSFHRKMHHRKHANIPEHCPFCSECSENKMKTSRKPKNMLTHILVDHVKARKRTKVRTEADPISNETQAVKFNNETFALDKLHFKEHHNIFFYPESTLEKMKESDEFLESFSDRLKNLLFICFNSVKNMPTKINTKSDRILTDIIKLKCSVPNTKSYPKDTVCFECNKIFDSFSKRLSHYIESHQSETEYLLQCAICSEKVLPGKDGQLHMKKFHKKILTNLKKDKSWKLGDLDEEGKILVQCSEGIKYQCDLCSLLCSTELSFWHHRKVDHKASLLSFFEEQFCKPCVITKFESEWGFFLHTINKHGGYQYKCPICFRGYNKNTMLKEHFKVHAVTGVSEIKHGNLQKLSGKRSGLYRTQSCICDICSKPLKSHRMLAQHKSNFHGIDVQCACRVPKCNLIFQSFREESKHFREVHQKFQTTCHVCGKMLVGKGLLQTHIEQEHSDQIQKYVCQICSKELKTLQNLKNHMIIHDASHKGHECTFCGKTFRWTTSLNSHIKAAHSVTCKSFGCPECGKVFKDPTNLKAHRYTHSSIKPYNCTKCGRGFVRKDTWLTHTSSCNTLPVNFQQQI